jgi:Helix-turn-helix domain
LFLENRESRKACRRPTTAHAFSFSKNSSMINIHHNLIREDLKTIGSDGLTVLLVIASFIGKDRSAFPKFQTIKSMCGLSKERTYKALATLQGAGYLDRSQENVAGEWGKVTYRISTDKLGIWINANEFELEEDNRLPETRHTENRNTDNRNTETRHTLSINKDKSIDKNKSIDKEKEAPSLNPESFNYASETKPFDAEPTIEKSEKRYLEASQKIKDYFARCPDDMILICDLAKKKLSPVRFVEELDKWLYRNVENLTLIQNPVARLKFGESSFKSWIEKPWVSDGDQKQNQNGYANRNTETANERITRVAGGAIELHNELLAKHGLL